MYELVRTEATHHVHALADTLSKWLGSIIRMWLFLKNKGITEEVHRKIKGIQRRAYGYLGLPQTNSKAPYSQIRARALRASLAPPRA